MNLVLMLGILLHQLRLDDLVSVLGSGVLGQDRHCLEIPLCPPDILRILPTMRNRVRVSISLSPISAAAPKKARRQGIYSRSSGTNADDRDVKFGVLSKVLLDSGDCRADVGTPGLSRCRVVVDDEEDVKTFAGLRKAGFQASPRGRKRLLGDGLKRHAGGRGTVGGSGVRRWLLTIGLGRAELVTDQI